MKSQILVTGGLGYIGSHTVVALIEAGYEPIIVDNLSNTQISVLSRLEKICNRKITFYETSILDKAALNKVFKNHKIASVIHFAAFKAVGESVLQPLKYYENNIGGLISLLQVMESNKISNIIFSSSCTVYGEPETLPVNETAPTKEPTSPYGATKQMGEQILKDSFSNCIALRYFNPIGAHSSALIGEMPLGVPNNLIPYITQTAIGKRPHLTINGNDYETKDGTNVRDYIHVMDLAEAHVAAVVRLENTAKKYEIFNIGTGKGNSVLEIVTLFEKCNNVKLNYTIGPRRQGDVIAVWADATIANTVLGWTAKRTLKDGLTSAWAWELYAQKLGL